MGYCKSGADAAKEQWIHESNLRCDFNRLLLDTEDIERRAYWGSLKSARKSWALNFRLMKTDGTKTWVVKGNYLSHDEEYLVSDTKEDFYVSERMRKTDHQTEAIKYLNRMISHEGLLIETTRRKIRAELADLCASNEARYSRSDRHEFRIGT